MFVVLQWINYVIYGLMICKPWYFWQCGKPDFTDISVNVQLGAKVSLYMSYL